MLKQCYLTMMLALWSVSTSVDADEGPVAHWRFDGGSGQVTDLSGRGHAAKLTGGKVVTDNNRQVVAFDGKTRCEIPSASDLHLTRGFSIEAVVKPTDISDGRSIVFKANEYMLRIDWPVEGSRISFFVYVDNRWESRVSAYTPEVGTWYHLVATWDGYRSLLWVNGQPFSTDRDGDLPKPNDNPVLIGSQVGYGGGFIGNLEFVKIYQRVLTSAEIIKRAYGIPESAPLTGSTKTVFEFRDGLQDWSGREGAKAGPSESGMVVKTSLPRSLALNSNLNAPLDRRDFLSLRMAVDKGTRAEVVFATTKGAGRIPFQTYDDGKMHTYVLEPWQWVGWGGNLLALGLAPSDKEQTTATVQYVRVTGEVQAEPEIQVMDVFPEATLPRAGRIERVTARVRNVGGPAKQVKVSLKAPEGVSLKNAAAQVVSALGYLEQKEFSWKVEAAKPTEGELRVGASAQDSLPAGLSTKVTFLPNLRLAKAAYVPKPVPAKTDKYTIWTHYCPLWKHGTHTGWKAVEPYPDRKPVIGWYDEGTPEVADWHIKYWLEHGISAAIYCWYRANLNGPVVQSLGHAIHDGLLKAKYLPMIKFAIMWENGCGQGVGSKEDLMQNVLPFWIDNYFSNPSYLRVDGKPVLYVWVPGNVTRDLGGIDNVRKTFEEMREVCRKKGLGGLYIVGCCGGVDRAYLERMKQEGWDASSAYGNGWIPPKDLKTVGSFVCAPVGSFIDQQEKIWKGKREFDLLPDITAAMMGWDSRPWNETAFFWSDNTPEKFRDLCLRAKTVMDSTKTNGPEKNTMIFCCWNEFGEGHYIEPTRGYGFSYLDVIREVFTEAPKPHVDFAPEDVGLGPYDSWYREARKAAPTGGASSDTEWKGGKLAAWGGMMGLDQVKITEGVLHSVSNTTDPAFSSPPLKTRANRFSKVIVEMRVSKPGGAQLFWSTSSMPHASETTSAHVTTVADGAFHPYAFEVGKSEYWGGCVTGLRLDPTAQQGATIEIRSIRFE
ncbi:MAG: glycoside hydrolase family 99-like domain-containing protein [Armatimonadetes bacterium]|nr:glycoside hydrolase family 99-like domain-containing protein [Armatimonadota bacterium]